MKTFSLVAALTLVLSSSALTQSLPASETVPDEKETTVTCELTQAPSLSQAPVLSSMKEAEATKGTYHYKLWLPKGYAVDPQKRWPCIFVMSPGGNASMGKMQTYLKSNGFIVVLLTEAKNGPWEPIVGNFLAAHDDVTRRFRVQEGRKYATGFSGGARGSSVFVQARPGFCGLLMQGAGPSFASGNNYHSAAIVGNPALYVAMTMGTSDSNKREVDRVRAMLPPARFAVFDFEGGHAWAPEDVFAKAMAWLGEKTGGGTAKGSADPFDQFFHKK